MRPRKFGLTHTDTKRATPGFTLFSPIWGTTAYLIDMAGEVVHQWDLPGNPGGYCRLLPNGNLFTVTCSDDGPPFPGGAQGGLMREVDWDNNLVNEYVDHLQHHDARRLANGHTVYTGWEKMPAETAAKVQGGIPGTEIDGEIWSDYVKEVDAGGNTVWEWHAHSDMPVQDYPLHPLCPRRVFAWCNTTDPLDNGDVMISLRQINLVAIIDRETKNFRFARRHDAWGHQHDSQMLPNGNIMLFANGMNTPEAQVHSYITEFNPETNETVWEYRDNPRSHFFSHHISGCQRLASGNTLICEGAFGRIFEVTPEADIVWEFVSPHYHPMFNGDDVNWVFRALRYAEDSPEIGGRVSL